MRISLETLDLLADNLPRTVAHAAIATNWIAVYKRYVRDVNKEGCKEDCPDLKNEPLVPPLGDERFEGLPADR